MKDFFSRYSYKIIKMFVTQFAIGLFGAVLTFATSGISNAFLIVTSILSAVFYLFLIYTSAWEAGASDRISIDVGKIKKRPWLGIVISLIANIPNYIIAVIYTVCWFIGRGAESAATSVAFIMRTITVFVEGMFYGLMTAVSFGTRIDATGAVVPKELFNYWWAYFIITLPAILVCGLAYYLGTKNYHLTKMMEPVYPASDREPKIKKDRKDD